MLPQGPEQSDCNDPACEVYFQMPAALWTRSTLRLYTYADPHRDANQLRLYTNADPQKPYALPGFLKLGWPRNLVFYMVFCGRGGQNPIFVQGIFRRHID